MILASDTSATTRTRGFFCRKIIIPIKAQMTRGVSPRAIAWATASGSVSGIFPILGSTTLLGALIGFLTKLNQPVLQTFNWLVYPIQLITIPFFVRAGEFIFRAEPVPFSVPILLERFRQDPVLFLQEFGITGLHGVVAWCAIAPFLAISIYLITSPLLESARRRWTKI